MRSRNLLGAEFDKIIMATTSAYWRNSLDSVVEAGISPISAATKSIASTYNQNSKHLTHPPHLIVALFSTTWDRSTVQTQYMKSSIGLSVVDDFLSKSHLKNFIEFCLRVQLSGLRDRYSYGRLGIAVFSGWIQLPAFWFR